MRRRVLCVSAIRFLTAGKSPGRLGGEDSLVTLVSPSWWGAGQSGFSPRLSAVTRGPSLVNGSLFGNNFVSAVYTETGSSIVTNEVAVRSP